MENPEGIEDLVRKLGAGEDTEQQSALKAALLSGEVSSILGSLEVSSEPIVRPVPTEVRGFRVRLDLIGAKPPVWRRLELPSDVTLSRLHDVIQAGMGWTDSHLHRFRTGGDHRSAYFLTGFDLDEGDEGTLEDDVRLDQVITDEGDKIWYDYDFGDGWDHVLTLESGDEEPTSTARVLDGRGACPPEDCGGIGGYDDLARWVRGGYDSALLPEPFENPQDARDWLPPDWHPDQLDLAEANDALVGVLAEPVAVAGELLDLFEQLHRRGIRSLREVLSRPASHGPTDVAPDDATRLVEPYSVLLDLIGDGVALTSAGYLPPSLVEQLAERTGITGWWIGKANREDFTPPVASIRDTARTLGLVSVRKGRLSPTAAAVRMGSDPQALLDHIVSRLPLGTKDFDRHAGWMTLALAGSGVSADDWYVETGGLLADLGWRDSQASFGPPSGHNPTMSVLRNLAGATRRSRATALPPAVSATARAVILRG